MQKDINNPNFASITNIGSNIYVSEKLQIVSSNYYTESKEEQEKEGVCWSEILTDNGKSLVFVKYLPFKCLKDSIEKEYFYFSSPHQWEDTFEHLLPTNVLEGDMDKEIRCTCFGVTDFGNEEGFWKLFRKKDENDPIVAVTYNVKELFSALSCEENSEIEFYLNGVSYVPRNEILQKLQKHSARSSLKDTLRLMSLKRFAFGHEQELRLFAVRKANDCNHCKPNEGIKVHCNYSNKAIVAITMPPLSPFKKSDVRYDHYKTFQFCHNLQLRKEIEELISQNNLQGCKALQSALYLTEENLDPNKFFVGEINGLVNSNES